MAFARLHSRIFARQFASAADNHGKGDPTVLWRNLYLFVGIPATLLGLLNCYLSEQEHVKQEFIPYEHLRIRNKRFPWGDGQRSLFHNPHTNALPTGYEDE
ncbi:PREDICTED: cytochrome c oxidase subunit 6A1, mitochondrial-like [Polistes dominula]|uniref:Cytochrome c oxidase subunit 6A1, mitochondrial-like n=1 Tax=Polistes dominula TaxID=743375 RepID=A0ABM1I645_POLDO|nr:PREDICTED: cytochrome c oxidase subunit 6A1, mitochondrial-like [Polistes dominula]